MVYSPWALHGMAMSYMPFSTISYSRAQQSVQSHIRHHLQHPLAPDQKDYNGAYRVLLQESKSQLSILLIKNCKAPVASE